MPLRRNRGASALLSVLAVLALAALVVTPFASARPDAAAAPVEIVIGFEDGVSAAQRAEVLAEAGVRVEETLSKLDAVVASERAPEVQATLAKLRAEGVVAYASRTNTFRPTLVPNDPGYTAVNWPYVQTGLPNAWDVTTGTASTIVAVIDSGIEFGHADLPALSAGYDFVDNDADPADDGGHGTAVTGTVGALLNGVGAAGVCPGCTIMPIKVIDALTGLATDTDIVDGIVWATDHGADVLNLSLGDSAPSQLLQDAVDYATSRGVVVVASAGNDGTTELMYPAATAGVIGVAATESNEALAWYSNHGSHLELAAPGCFQTTLLAGGYGQFCGTSIAAPVVAGIVGLVRSRYPGLSRSQVESALLSAANKLPNLDVQHGVVDAYRALVLAGSMTPVPANTTLPQISGTTKEGEKLTATQGSWSNSPTSYSYAWQRCNGLGAICVPIAGVTAATYRLSNSDIGSTIRVVVTAKNGGGDSLAATSAQTAVVTGTAPLAGSGVDVYATIGASTTTPAVGSTVDFEIIVGARPGTVSAETVQLVVTMPTGLTYTSSSATRGSCTAAGQKVTCQLDYLAYPLVSEVSVTATVGISGQVTVLAAVTPTPADAKPDDNTVTQTVTVPAPETSTLPPPPGPDPALPPDGGTETAKPAPLTIGGPAKVGKRLTARPGTGWAGSEPLRLRYQWQTCATVKGKLRCTNLRGKTTSTLVISTAYLGKRLRVVATGLFADGKAERRTSRLTRAVRR
jgi:uncharacterized repeat protein (TIGR01451 family)